MKKIYEAPELFVDEYAADTMIASSGMTEWQMMGGSGSNPKNGNAINNHNCWGCEFVNGAVSPENSSNACLGGTWADGTPAWACE